MINKSYLFEDLKKYITNNMINSFTGLKVEKAYKPEDTLTTPSICISISDDGEDTASNSYDSENMSNVVVVFYCYNKAMRFNDDSEKTDVVESTRILSDELTNILNKNKLCNDNFNIISSTRNSYVQPQPVREDKTYVAIIRYAMKVLNDYTKIYNN